MNKKLRVALLGGSGFLGRHLEKLQLSGVDLKIFDLAAPRNSSAAFQRVDLLVDSNLKPALADRDIVINLTGQVSRPMEICEKLNSEGLGRVVAALPEMARFVQISTVSVYGSGGRVDENSSLQPETDYGQAKLLAENLLRESLPAERLLILRLPNLYGEGQMKGVLAYLLRSAQSDRNLEFDNDGSLLRYYLHAADAARLIWSAVENGLIGIYNIPGEGPLSIQQLISVAEESLGITFNSRFEERTPPDNIEDLSFERMRKKLDFTPQNSVKGYLESQSQIYVCAS